MGGAAEGCCEDAETADEKCNRSVCIHRSKNEYLIQWNLCNMDTLEPTKIVLMIKVSCQLMYVLKDYFGTQLSVWILQVFLFSSAHPH